MNTTTQPEPTTEAKHYHDLGITISVGDLEPEQLAAMRIVLETGVQALVKRVNDETSALTGQTVGWAVTYDGSRECGEH
jgi:hypothetical protein